MEFYKLKLPISTKINTTGTLDPCESMDEECQFGYTPTLIAELQLSFSSIKPFYSNIDLKRHHIIEQDPKPHIIDHLMNVCREERMVNIKDSMEWEINNLHNPHIISLRKKFRQNNKFLSELPKDDMNIPIQRGICEDIKEDLDLHISMVNEKETKSRVTAGIIQAIKNESPNKLSSLYDQYPKIFKDLLNQTKGERTIK